MKSEEIIEYVKVTAVFLQGEFNITKSGKPRIIYRFKNGTKASIVFVSRIQYWKMFIPFPAIEQERFYFKNIKEMQTFIRERNKWMD